MGFSKGQRKKQYTMDGVLPGYPQERNGDGGEGYVQVYLNIGVLSVGSGHRYGPHCMHRMIAAG